MALKKEPKTDPYQKVKEKHKEIFYNFLTKFAYLDTLVAYCIASHFKDEKKDKIEITDLLISDFNSQKQFDIFIRILKIKGEQDIERIEKLYSSARNLRNLLAHSYLVPTNNTKYNGKAIKLTRLSNSKGTGYTENLQVNEYETKMEKLSELVKYVFTMVKNIKQK